MLQVPIKAEISKVKIGDRIIIDYITNEATDSGKEETKEIKLSSSDTPLSSFGEATQSFLEEVIQFIGLDEDKWVTAKVIGINFKPESRGTGLVISATCMIDELPVNVNTPYINPELIDKSVQEKVDRLIIEVNKFVNGERSVKQMELL